jgi:hypothetical protein
LAQTHVVMLRSHMAKEYFIQYQEGKLPGFPKNLTDEQIAPRGASSCHHLPTCDDKTGSQPCAEALKVDTCLVRSAMR